MAGVLVSQGYYNKVQQILSGLESQKFFVLQLQRSEVPNTD